MLVLAGLEPEPADRPLLRVDDQQLLHPVGGIERKLLPRLVAGRDDLEHERGGRQVHGIGARTNERAIRGVVVALTPQVELTQRPQTSAVRQRCQDPGELPFELSVLGVRRTIHVQHTLPDLVEQILPEPTAPLEQRLEFRWLWVTYERRHTPKATAGPDAR